MKHLGQKYRIVDQDQPGYEVGIWKHLKECFWPNTQDIKAHQEKLYSNTSYWTSIEESTTGNIQRCKGQKYQNYCLNSNWLCKKDPSAPSYKELRLIGTTSCLPRNHLGPEYRSAYQDHPGTQFGI